MLKFYDDVKLSFMIEEDKKKFLKDYCKQNKNPFDDFIRNIIISENHKHYKYSYNPTKILKFDKEFKRKSTKLDKDKKFVVICLNIENNDKEVLKYICGNKNISVGEYIRQIFDFVINIIKNNGHYYIVNQHEKIVK